MLQPTNLLTDKGISMNNFSPLRKFLYCIQGHLKAFRKLKNKTQTIFFSPIVGSELLPLSYFIKTTHILLTLPFSNVVQYPPRSFSCLVSMTECVITLHLIYYFWIILWTCLALLPQYQQHLAVCFMQQGIKFTEGLTRIIWFLLVL